MGQKPLEAELERLNALDLEGFPVAEDFMVDLRVADSGTTLRYMVPSWEMSISFPWWNRNLSELREWTLEDIPGGTQTAPFWDRDQGWNLLIWEAGQGIFIAEGDGDPDVYERWFTVPLHLYRSEWRKAIEVLRRDF